MEPVTYLHPLLEPFLEKTYGVFVYQEDIRPQRSRGRLPGPRRTRSATRCARRSRGAPVEESKFVNRAAERGDPPDIIDAVFKAIEPFERYGFNKAHGTCYGLIAYQTAYLKANYTVEYMASVLTAVRDSRRRWPRRSRVPPAGHRGGPPDVTASGLHFTVEGEAIRFGLWRSRTSATSAIESIVLASEAAAPSARSPTVLPGGPAPGQPAGARVVIKVGALNALGHPAQLLLALDDALASGQAAQRDRITGQVSLFDSMGIDEVVLERPLPNATEASSRERLRWEKELLGLYLSDHPLGELAADMGKYANAYSGDMGEELDQQRIVIGGVVTGLRRVVTKAKATMAVATIEDLQGSLEVVVFPKVFEETMATWTDDAVLLVAGRVDHKGDETVLLADAVWTWDDVVAMGPGAVHAGGRRRVTDRGAEGAIAVRGATAAAAAAPPNGGPGAATGPGTPP